MGTRTNRARVVAAVLVSAVVSALLLSSCSNPLPADPFAHAKAVNESRHVAERFEEHPVVLDDVKGMSSLQYFFTSSETLVVSDATIEAQLRAASIAIIAHAPMLVYDPARHQEIAQEVERLRTYTVLTVGDVALAQSSGQVRVYRDPGGMDALETMTALRFGQRTVERPEDAAMAIAGIDPQDPVWLRAAWADPKVMPQAEARPFPILSRRDAQMAPVVVATAASSIASIANARSFGADVTMVDDPDPRHSEQTLFAMAGLSEAPLVALGSQFGDEHQLSAKIMQAEEFYLSKNADKSRPQH